VWAYQKLPTVRASFPLGVGQCVKDCATIIVPGYEQITPKLCRNFAANVEQFAMMSSPAPLTLWYEQPAANWNEALPLGNGRLGAMVFGGINHERIQLNEETLWDGYPQVRHNPQALEALPEMRRLLFAGQNKEAEALVEERMLGIPPRVKSYQTLGDLFLEFDDLNPLNSYERDLDLEAAVCRTRFFREFDPDVRPSSFHLREVFVSSPHNVLVVRLLADNDDLVSVRIRLTRGEITGDRAWHNRNMFAPNHRLEHFASDTLQNNNSLQNRTEFSGDKAEVGFAGRLSLTMPPNAAFTFARCVVQRYWVEPFAWTATRL
jgi:hypothetical protein